MFPINKPPLALPLSLERLCRNMKKPIFGKGGGAPGWKRFRVLAIMTRSPESEFWNYLIIGAWNLEINLFSLS
jgi:hypothetical protein